MGFYLLDDSEAYFGKAPICTCCLWLDDHIERKLTKDGVLLIVQNCFVGDYVIHKVCVCTYTHTYVYIIHKIYK